MFYRVLFDYFGRGRQWRTLRCVDFNYFNSFHSIAAQAEFNLRAYANGPHSVLVHRDSSGVFGAANKRMGKVVGIGDELLAGCRCGRQSIAICS